MPRRLLIGLLAFAALWALPGIALARPVPRAQLGKLPGFPRVRGVQPVLADEADVKAREALVKSAFAAARADHAHADHARAYGKTPVPNEEEISICVSEIEEAEALFTQEPCYRGGPVLRDPAIHLIFWQGQVKGTGREESVQAFPAGYIEAVEQYFANVAHASGSLTNDFAVDSEYFSEESGLLVPGEYALRFKTKSEVSPGGEEFSYLDTTGFPAHSKSECPGPTYTSAGKRQASTGPCLLDQDLHEVVEAASAAEKWNRESVTAGSSRAGNVFVVLTPPGVGGCFVDASNECAYTSYCAYHGDFGGNGESAGGQTVYENLPYIGGIAGCEIFKVHPTQVTGADAAIDTANHETNEAITDPLGSQCNEEAGEVVGCEPFSWMDAAGQEVADKCLPPETPFGDIYGEPLGTLTPGGGAEREAGGFYNEAIGSGHYWTQTIWSLAATIDGGCVQRIVPTSFPEPSAAAATVPTTFNGADSGEPADPAVYWAWSFGDGTQAATSSGTIAHTYAAPGAYSVTLTAYDAYGNSYTFTREVHVGAAPPPQTSTTTTTTTTVTDSASSVHRTAAQIAKLLGLPAGGAKLSGAGLISLGHAQCPPACGIHARLVAEVREGKHVRHLQVGSIQETVAGTSALAIKLTVKGQRLLKDKHKLRVLLIVAVEEGSGAKWTIERQLTLVSGAKAARRPRSPTPRRG